MMASGLPVVDLYLDNNLYDMPDSGVTLAHYTPESIAQALINIIDNPQIAKQLSEYGQEYMKKRTLEYGYNQFYQAVDNLVNNRITSDTPVTRVYKKDPVIADVILQNSVQEDTYQELTQPSNCIWDTLKHNRWLRKSKFVRGIWKYITGC